MMTDDMKICSRCKRRFPRTRAYFFADKGHKDGFGSACKECLGRRLGSYAAPIQFKDGMKRCSRCNRFLPVTDEYFHREHSRPGGIKDVCKECSGFKFTIRRNDGLKECSSGENCKNPNGFLQPATREYFGHRRDSNDGLTSQCRYCQRERGRNYKPKNPIQAKETRKRWRDANRGKLRERSRQWDENNSEKVRESRQKSRVTRADKIRHYNRKYRADHKEERREYNRRYRADNRERYRLLDRKYYQSDLEKSRLKGRVYVANRQARKRNLPNTFTQDLWQRAITYFNGCCAACGRPLNDLFGSHTAAADHWIALSDPRPDNPGTVAANIVPLCHGENGCNNGKWNRPAEKWLIERFGKRRAREILKRIEAYFQWVREQDGGD